MTPVLHPAQAGGGQYQRQRSVCDVDARGRTAPDDLSATGPGRGLALDPRSVRVRRRTRTRLLGAALKVLNEHGEPGVTLITLARLVSVSHGTMYYHFRSKDDIVRRLLHRFVMELGRAHGRLQGRYGGVEGAWRALRYMFALVWRYRFLSRDSNDLLSRHRALKSSFEAAIGQVHEMARELCDNLRKNGALKVDSRQCAALATNMVVVGTYWLSYEYALDPRSYNEQASGADRRMRGCYQVLSVISPFLLDDAQRMLHSLATREVPGTVEQGPRGPASIAGNH